MNNFPDLYIFTYGALFFRDHGARPRRRAGVDRWFAQLVSGHIAGQVAILWPCPGVGKRYTLARAGVDLRRLTGLPDEETAVSNGQRLAEEFSATVYQSFSWHNYTDKRADLGPGLTPEERTNDPRWSAYWRLPDPGLIAAALRGAEVGPGQALLICEHTNERRAADRLYVPHVHGPRFFIPWPNYGRFVERRPVIRRDIDDLREMAEGGE